jgi:endonuclease G, mitochondrial
MPSSVLVHAAVFAVGATVGGGIATVLAKQREKLANTTAKNASILAPVVEVDARGAPQISGVPAVPFVSPILKYGNPGMPC